jgi:ABC-2 type transport system permease protein
MKWNTIKIFAFAKRSFLLMLSYKLAFMTSFISPLLWVFLFGMFGRVFAGVEIPALAAYGGDYVSYILLGTLFWQFVSIGLNTTAAEIRGEATIGTLEAIFITPTNVAVVFPGVSLVSLFLTGIFTTLTVSLGITLFNFNIGGGNYWVAALMVLLTYFSTLGLGMIIAGLTILYKNVGTLVGIFITLMMFLSGVYFPVSVLPGILYKKFQQLSH